MTNEGFLGVISLKTYVTKVLSLLLISPRGGALKYESDVQVPTGERKESRGGIRCKILSQKGVIICGHQNKMGSFLVWNSKNGAIQCAKMQFQAKICKSYVKIVAKLLNFSKIHTKRAEICNLCVKLDTEVEKWGSLGVN